MPICKMCGTEKKKLVRCHIYPQSMSKEVAGNSPLVSISMRNGNPISHYSHGGIYDDEIVCAECEFLFKEADDYAIDFRRTVLSLSAPIDLPYRTVRLPSFKAKSEVLHRFACQTVLRSHLSHRFENQQVNQGPLANRIADAILRKRETMDLGIGVAYLFFTSEIAQVMMSPICSDNQDYPICSLWMPNMNIIVSANKNDLPDGFSPITLKQGHDVTVLRNRKIFSSDENDMAESVIPHYGKLKQLFGRYKGRK